LQSALTLRRYSTRRDWGPSRSAFDADPIRE
jgi:hypothetical protein